MEEIINDKELAQEIVVKISELNKLLSEAASRDIDADIVILDFSTYGLRTKLINLTIALRKLIK